MKSFYVEIDINDGDYVGHIVTISKKDFERFKPLIEKIKNFESYKSEYNGFTYVHHHNFPSYDGFRGGLGEKSVCELYDIDEDTLDDFIDTFELYGGEYGFHTITKIQEVTLGEEIL